MLHQQLSIRFKIHFYRTKKCICQIRQILNSVKSTFLTLNSGLTSAVEKGQAIAFMWQSCNHLKKKLISHLRPLLESYKTTVLEYYSNQLIIYFIHIFIHHNVYLNLKTPTLVHIVQLQ